jgi:hypothetical protein
MRVMLLHKLAEDIPEDYVPPQKLIADPMADILKRCNEDRHPPPSTGASRCC